jgi:hypothetical protein
MNKKLFSWKALAGLALLVAMGLTSCKPGAEVDPSDPTGQTKPVTPSTSVKDANVVLTVTKVADFNDQWSKNVKGDVLTELKKQNEITVLVKGTACELDGSLITIPGLWDSANGKTLNIVFDGFKKAEKPLNLDVSTNLAGAIVNISLPDQKIDFTVDASKVQANVQSGSIGRLTANANVGKNALTIDEAVTVSSIDPIAGDFVGKTGALYVNSSADVATFKSEKGFNVCQTTENYVKDLIIDGAANVNVATDAKTDLGDIIIEKGGKLTLGTNKSVASVQGTKPAETELTFANPDDIAKVGSIKNVKITNTLWIDLGTASVDGVEFAGPVELSTTNISNITFDDKVQINVDGDNKTYSFTGVNFAATSTIVMNSTLKQSVSKVADTYFWDVENNTWQLVDATHPNIYAADKQVVVSVSQDAADIKYTVSGTTLSDALKAEVTAKTNTIKITTIWYDNLAPKNTVVSFDKNCKQKGETIDGEYLTDLFGTKWSPSAIWFKVNVDGTTYAWKELAGGGYILVKE